MRLRVRAMLPQLPFGASADQGRVVFTAAKHSAQRAVSAVAAVLVVPSCPLLVVPLCLESNRVKLGIYRPIV